MLLNNVQTPLKVFRAVSAVSTTLQRVDDPVRQNTRVCAWGMSIADFKLVVIRFFPRIMWQTLAPGQPGAFPLSISS